MFVNDIRFYEKIKENSIQNFKVRKFSVSKRINKKLGNQEKTKTASHFFQIGSFLSVNN
jgi:hypothetical protein